MSYIAKRRAPLQTTGDNRHDDILYSDIDGNDIKFIYRYLTYEYDQNQNAFITVSFDFQKTHLQIHRLVNGISEDDHSYLISKFGECTMNIIVNNWYKLLFEEVLNSFYFFQIF